jgi:hypothetical protein
VVDAYATSARALVAVITALAAQTQVLQAEVEAGFGRDPDVEIYRSQPGLSEILGARVLAEFGDDPTRYADAKARRNYAGTSPITKASGKTKVVLARHVRNRRLADAVYQQAFSALNNSPGARAYYDAQRARKVGHHQALRALSNRLVGIPARLPPPPHALRRDPRLGTPTPRSTSRCLTADDRGMSSGFPRAGRPHKDTRQIRDRFPVQRRRRRRQQMLQVLELAQPDRVPQTKSRRQRLADRNRPLRRHGQPARL